MHILMISVPFPYPPSRGGTPVRTFHLLQQLGRRHQVTLVTQEDPLVGPQQVEELRQWVQRLVIFPRAAAQLQPGLKGKARRFLEFALRGTPPHVNCFRQDAMQAWIDRWVEQGRADAITCEHSVNEIFVRPHYRHQVSRLVVNIHSSLYGTLVQQLRTGTAENPVRDLLNVPLIRRYERRYASKFTDLVVTTPEDRRFFLPLRRQAPLHVVPNGVDLAKFPLRSHDPGGHNLVFVGAMDYIANVDTAKYLAQELLPSLRRRYSQATLTLVGSQPNPAVQALGQLPGVQVTGQVPQVVDYLHRATVCVIPMRIGYGIKNKTLEAMAAGVPVVASDRGLEGLAVDCPLAALRANRLTEYLEAIEKLFEQPQLRQQMTIRARKLIEAEFTWDQIGQKYDQILQG